MERSSTDRTMRIGLFYPHTVDRRDSVGRGGGNVERLVVRSVTLQEEAEHGT